MARYAKYTDVLVARLEDVRSGRYGPVFGLKCQPPKEGKKVPPEMSIDLQMSREASTALAREIREKFGNRDPKGIKVRVEGFRLAGAKYRNANVDDGERHAKGEPFPEGEEFRIETVNSREVKRVYYSNAWYGKGRSANIVPSQENEGIFDGSNSVPVTGKDALPESRSVSAIDRILGDAVEEQSPAPAPAPAASNGDTGGYAAMVAKLVKAGVPQQVAEQTAAAKLADTL